MKIIIDARLFGLENAGLGRYVMNLVSEICKNKSANQYYFLLRKKYFDSILVPHNCQKVLADFGHYTFAEQLKLAGLIKSIDPDLVHFPHFNTPLFYRGLCVVTIHDLLMHKQVGIDATTLSPISYYIKRIAYKLVFRNAVLKAEKIIVPSRAVKDEIESYYKVQDDKVEVVYEGFDIQNFTSESPSNTGKYESLGKYFIYTGNAYPHKNLPRLIEAMVLLNQNLTSKVKLVIASSRNVFTKRLEKIIDQLNAKKFVSLLGFVPDSDLVGLYKNSVGLVTPSLSEGFGLPGIEAMYAGTLVLASNIPVYKEIYKDNAIYFNQLDFSSIETSMRNALNISDRDRQKIITKSKEFAKSYSWSKMAEQTINIYEKTYRDSLRQNK